MNKILNGLENSNSIDTPIYDFVLDYSKSGNSRFHMPGHKGVSFVGCEKMDITEIDGADVLYTQNFDCNKSEIDKIKDNFGIIYQSEKNAAKIFRTKKTIYSTEGASHCIRAMLGAVAVENKCGIGNNIEKEKTIILAARNVHKAFVYAAAALDLEVEWLYPQEFTHLCACNITIENISNAIARTVSKYGKKPDAIYITSPDYMGNIANIREISSICHKENILLLVDNAHGAYLAFLDKSEHPIHLGADICCDSAHKTLPVLTGGAYLHFAEGCNERLIASAENMFRIFGSTSPSYLILSSIDLCNKYLFENFRDKLHNTISKVNSVKDRLKKMGFDVLCTEPLKIVINMRSICIDVDEFVKILSANKMFIEMYDEYYAIFMISTENTDIDFERLLKTFEEITILKSKLSLDTNYEMLCEDDSLDDLTQSDLIHENAMTIREAMFSSQRVIPVEEAKGMVCASPVVACPPAIPVVISGEVIKDIDIKIMKKYSINTVAVVE